MMEMMGGNKEGKMNVWQPLIPLSSKFLNILCNVSVLIMIQDNPELVC